MATMEARRRAAIRAALMDTTIRQVEQCRSILHSIAIDLDGDGADVDSHTTYAKKCMCECIRKLSAEE
jgi:hypothetical protein